MHPAREADRLADVRKAKLAASMGAIVVHDWDWRPGGARFRERAEQRMGACACQGRLGHLFCRLRPATPAFTSKSSIPTPAQLGK
jgi:hypothetical protein